MFLILYLNFMRKTIFLIAYLLVSQLIQAQTQKYFKHLIFRETPYSQTEGRIPLTEKEAKNVNHFELSYNASNKLISVEYKYQQNLITLNRSGILDGKKALAPRTQIKYEDDKEIRTFFDVNGKQTINGMGVFKEVYSYNKKGKRIGLKFFDKNDRPINNSWKVFEYKWKHIDNNSVLEKRKNVSGTNVPMRPYYKFYNVLYKFNDKGILISMNNVDKKMRLINDETGIAIDKASYDKDNNLISFNFFNAENKPVIGSFLETAGGFATYNDNGDCLKYATTGLDGNYKIDKRSNNAYSSYKFDSIGNLIDRSNYGLNNKKLKRKGVTNVEYVYDKDNPIELQITIYHHTVPKTTAIDSVLFKSNRKIAKEKLIEDFDQLLETLKGHPEQFEFIDNVAYNRLTNAQRNKLIDSMTVKEFYQIASPIVTSLGCLHTRIVDVRFFRTPPKYWLPLIVRFEDGKLYAINNCVENVEMTAGSEILEINGVSSRDIYKTLKSTISADAHNQSFYKGDLNVNFLYYYHAYYGFGNSYKIKFKPYNSKKEITTTFLIDQPVPNYKTEIVNKPRLSLDIKAENNTAIIKIKNFNYFPRGRQNIDFFKENIDTYMARIKKENISKVVFDLRGNRGGNPECTKHILSYITNKDINFYKDNDLNKRRNRPTIVKPQTVNNISTSNTYVLTDGRCASATAQMLAIVKYNQLATIVGEETGGTYSTHPGRRAAALKNTKLALQLGTERESVNVSKLPFNKGIIPDKKILLNVEDILLGQDTLLNYIFNQ